MNSFNWHLVAGSMLSLHAGYLGFKSRRGEDVLHLLLEFRGSSEPCNDNSRRCSDVQTGR